MRMLRGAWVALLALSLAASLVAEEGGRGEKAGRDAVEAAKTFAKALKKEDFEAVAALLDPRLVESYKKEIAPEKMAAFWKLIAQDLREVLDDAEYRAETEKDRMIVTAVSKKKRKEKDEAITENVRFTMVQVEGAWRIGAWVHGQTVEKN
jgi:hypothetical protein